MKLLVDIGNTRIKWASLAAGGLTDSQGFAHHGDPAAATAGLIEQVAEPPAAVLIANVAGAAFAGAVVQGIGARWNIEVQQAHTQASAGRVRNAYRDYAQLGVDRWLAILAAAHRYPGGACIVDVGTAVTIDLLAPGGEHLGGYILPGLDAMWRSLTAGTGDLERLAGDDAVRAEASCVPGRGTGEAIGHGSLMAVCAAIEHCARRLAEDNREGIVVVTGGAAGRVIPHVAVDLEHRPQLVLEGLAVWQPG
ncbi:MAG: type III pantothenate kinase [Gammaproteobacteria bacterium]